MAPTTDWSAESLKFTVPAQLTKTIHREVYEAISPTNPANSAKGKIIAITGGATGIGLATAEVWLQAGAEGVIITGRRQNKLDEASKSLQKFCQAGSKVLAINTDIKLESDTQKIFTEAKATFGRLPEVVVANAGVATSDLSLMGDSSVKEWWNVLETNLLGVHNTVHSYISAQDDPKKPKGTIININSNAASFLMPGVSSYAISKLAAQRYIEFVDAEYPDLRAFSVHPGAVHTDMTPEVFMPYAKDAPDLAGAWALYLARPEADYLRGSFIQVNWDISELEPHKEQIAKDRLLRLSWIPILPASGGKGFTE